MKCLLDHCPETFKDGHAVREHMREHHPGHVGGDNGE